jgi:hypothetical protein
MSRRAILALLATLAAVALAAVAIAAQDSGGGGGENLETTSAQTTSSTSTAQGDAREKNTGPIEIPEAGRLAGPPLRTARRFMVLWLNRVPSAAAVRRARPVLVGLSVGGFAQLMEVTARDALATGEFGLANRGTVEFARLIRHNAETAEVLLVCHERPQGGGELFTTYLAKLRALEPGRYALSDLEPES